MDAAEIRRTTEQVLSHPDYELSPDTDSSPSWLSEWLDGLWKSFTDAVARVIDFVGMLNPAMRYLAGAVVLVLIVAAVVTIRRRSRTRRQSQTLSPLFPESADSRTARLEAEAAAAAERGDYAEGVRHLLKASVIRLEAAEQRGHRPGTTNRGLLRRFASHRVLEPVRQLVETMDATWYGRRDCTREDFTECAAAAAQIRHLLEAGPKKVPEPRRAEVRTGQS